jgi:hypothetical protein
VETRVGQAGGDFPEAAVKDVVGGDGAGVHREGWAFKLQADRDTGVAEAMRARAVASAFFRSKRQLQATHDGDPRIVGRDEVGFGSTDQTLGKGRFE